MLTFIRQSSRILLTLTGIILVFFVLLGLFSDKGFATSSLITIEFIIGGSSYDWQTIIPFWLRWYAYAVRVLSWFIIPILIAVFINKAWQQELDRLKQIDYLISKLLRLKGISGETEQNQVKKAIEEGLEDYRKQKRTCISKGILLRQAKWLRKKMRKET